MTRAAGLLLEATERDVIDGENRLTEILASVLQAVPRFAAALMSEFGLPHHGPYEVNTQVHADGKFVDMEVLSLGSDGGVAGRLWAEHKIHAEFGPLQMENYLDRIQRRPGEWHLVGLVRDEALSRIPDPPSAKDAEPPPFFAKPSTETPARLSWRTWQQIATLADRVARSIGGPRWRETAHQEDARASLMLLSELIATLERRELAHMEPFSTLDVYALGTAEEALESLQALWARALQNVDGRFGPSKETGASGRFNIGSAYQHLETPPCWATDRYRGWGDFVFATTDWWKPEAVQMEAPCLGVGFTFPRGEASALSADQLGDWLERQGEGKEGVFLTEDGYVRLYGTLYLNEVVTSGLTLDDQAQFVASWMERTLDRLIDNPPPDVGP